MQKYRQKQKKHTVDKQEETEQLRIKVENERSKREGGVKLVLVILALGVLTTLSFMDRLDTTIAFAVGGIITAAFGKDIKSSTGKSSKNS